MMDAMLACFLQERGFEPAARSAERPASP